MQFENGNTVQVMMTMKQVDLCEARIDAKNQAHPGGSKNVFFSTDLYNPYNQL